MCYLKHELQRIWKSTNGRCHLTGAALRLSDYGRTWEVDHSKPKAVGGSDHGNNLKPVSANRAKQARSSRSVRREAGLTRAPLSAKAIERARTDNAVGGALGGAGVGALLGGPAGALFGALLGAVFGHDSKVE